MKNLLVLASWINLCLVTLLFSLVSLYQLSFKKPQSVLASQTQKPAKSQLQMYASLPPILGIADQNITGGDARPVLAENYLRKRGDSPLSPYTDYLVETCDKYFPNKYINCEKDLTNCQGEPLSCTGLVIAIAECESNLCKKIPEGSNNCWGYGIPTGAKEGTKFSSLEVAIEKEVELIKKYTDQGMLTLEDIGAVYAPPSVEKGHSWAKCVSHFLDELK